MCRHLATKYALDITVCGLFKYVHRMDMSYAAATDARKLFHTLFDTYVLACSC